MAVSYTHLDVYKRQRFLRSPQPVEANTLLCQCVVLWTSLSTAPRKLLFAWTLRTFLHESSVRDVVGCYLFLMSYALFLPYKRKHRAWPSHVLFLSVPGRTIFSRWFARTFRSRNRLFSACLLYTSFFFLQKFLVTRLGRLCYESDVHKRAGCWRRSRFRQQQQSAYSKS